MIISGAQIRRFKVAILLIVVLLVFGITFGASYLPGPNSNLDAAYAASTSCNYTGTWQNNTLYENKRGADRISIDDIQYFKSLSLKNTDLVFANPNAKLVISNGLSVDTDSTIWGVSAFDKSIGGNGTYKYIGDGTIDSIVDIDIEVCGGNFDLDGKINNDGANTWRRSGGETSSKSQSIPGNPRSPKVRSDGTVESSELSGEGGGGESSMQDQIVLIGGSGGGGNGGGGGHGLSVEHVTWSQLGGGGGGGVFANAGNVGGEGGRIENATLIINISKNISILTNEQKTQPELFLPTFGGRGGVPLSFAQLTPPQTYWMWGWDPDSNIYYKSAGGGFIKIAIRDGNLDFGATAMVSSRGTEGQDGAITTCSGAQGYNFTPNTGGGAGGTIYIRANKVTGNTDSHLDADGGSGTIGNVYASGALSGCSMGWSGGGGGGIIYFDVPSRGNVSAATNNLNASVEGGSNHGAPGNAGYVLWSYEMTSSFGGFAQVSKKTYKTSCGGDETSTFNSGDTVCVELTATSPSGSLSGVTVTDELPPGTNTTDISFDSGYPTTTKANPLSWTSQSISGTVTYRYKFKMP